MFKRKNLEIVALALWCAMIFGFSNVPSLSSGLPEDFLYRKIAHISEFFVLAFLFWLVFRGKKAGHALTFLVVFFASLDYAISDEIHQLFVAGRSGNFFDVGIDTIGILLAIMILWLWQRKYKRTA